MRRREFVAVLGGAALGLPVTARAQQPAMPVIGFLSSRSAADSAEHLGAFLQGLKTFGYGEGQNIRIEFRWANGHYDRFCPRVGADLIAETWDRN
jgi:hypothetical protein